MPAAALMTSRMADAILLPASWLISCAFAAISATVSRTSAPRCPGVRFGAGGELLRHRRIHLVSDRNDSELPRFACLNRVKENLIELAVGVPPRFIVTLFQRSLELALRLRFGRDLDPNYFDDLDHACAFFEECRFTVDSRPLLEGIRDQVVSLPQAPKDLLAELDERRTFVLTAN